MTDEIYARLADAMDRLPNGFPRTVSNVELKILQKIFPPEDAALAGHLTGTFELVDQIASRAGMPAEDASKQLFKMIRRGMVWLDKQDGQVRFRLAPFVVGVYEASLELMDHELAHLTEEYFASGGVAGIMGVQPALHRVVPAQAAVKTEWVLPYDDVRTILLNSKTFNVRDCICRVQKAQIGEPCDFPVNMCLNFSEIERASPRPGDISQVEALALLDRCEEVGLVHTVSNVMKGVGYVCNCCGCCCGILRGVTEYGLENSVAYANYFAVIDPLICNNCGTCIDRCQVGAISEGDDYSVVDVEHCIGCGLCVTGCPNDVAVLERRPEAEMIHPPVDFSVWEHERLHNRGLADLTYTEKAVDMAKIDYKKEYGDWYTASSSQAKWVVLSPVNYLMVDGHGDPNSAPEYQQAVEALYALSYGLKFKIKKGEASLDYGVLPLEGLWWVPDMNLFTQTSKDDWLWTMMILQPPFVTPQLIANVLAEVRQKKNLPGLERIRFENYPEGRAAQIMHIGPYAAEAPTIETLHAFIQSQGCLRRGKHHEIYLGDPRITAPEKLRTILRQPVE